MAEEEAVAPSIQDEEKKIVRVGGRRRAASINTRLYVKRILLASGENPKINVTKALKNSQKQIWTLYQWKKTSSGDVRFFKSTEEGKLIVLQRWCIGVITLKADPGGNIIRDYVFNKLTEFPRFRSSLKVGRFGGAFVELSPEKMHELRDSYFWTEIYTDGNATVADINKTVGETETWKFDKTLPLWRLQYCRKMANGEAVLISTVNHAIGDGVGSNEWRRK